MKIVLDILGTRRGKKRSAKQKENGVVVFSCFLAMLDLVEDHLKSLGFTTGKLTSQKKLAERATTIKSFQDGEIDVVLCGLKAVGQGVTLTRASAVVLLDPWWNLGQVLV